MDWILLVASVMAALLGAYLSVALMKPEWFS